jgi:hypothetical protein
LRQAFSCRAPARPFHAPAFANSHWLRLASSAERLDDWQEIAFSENGQTDWFLFSCFRGPRAGLHRDRPGSQEIHRLHALCQAYFSASIAQNTFQLSFL